MSDSVDHSSSLLEAARRQPASTDELLAQARQLALGLPTDPWARWLLVALSRHVPRQQWVARVVEEKLGGNVVRIATDGSLGHPLGRDQHGRVPGLDEWTFYFHGIGCCLTHSNGTSIDVDFDESGGSSIDPYFFTRYLASLHEPEPIESALNAPRALESWWMADLPALRSADLIRGDHRVALTPAGADLANALEPIVAEMVASESPLRRAWLAIVVGDLSRAHDALAHLGDAPEIREGALEQLQSRILQLSGPYQNGDQARLRALAHLGREYAERSVLAQLDRSPLDGITSTALDLLDLWDDPRFINPLISVAERAASAEIPEPHIRVTGCRLALRLSQDEIPSALRQRFLKLLQATTGASAGEGAFMLALLEYEAGLRALAAALKSTIPLAREDAAAALVLLGTREAMDILERSRSREARLVLERVPEQKRRPFIPVAQWIKWRGEYRPTYSFDDIIEANLPEMVTERLRSLQQAYGAQLARFRANVRS